jgi:hypothetical protein
MTTNHNYFEFLCALAASDELTGPELIELREHFLACVSCRNRMHEMARINACLLLSHAFNHRNRRLPKGMQERFIARAIKEGLPLKPASTVGLINVGLASALFIILLVTAAAIRTGPFSRPFVDANHFDVAQLSKPVQVTTPMTPESTMSRLPRRRDRSRGAKPRRVQVQWRLDPSGAVPSHLETFQNRYFPPALTSPHSMLAAMPSDTGRLSSWPYVPSRFSFAVGPALIRESALRLLAASEPGTANPLTLPSEFTFATPGAPGFHPSLDRDLYRTHPIFEFRDTPLKFHFVENVTQ